MIMKTGKITAKTEGRGSGLPHGKWRGSQAVQEHRAAGRAERKTNMATSEQCRRTEACRTDAAVMGRKV